MGKESQIFYKKETPAEGKSSPACHRFQSSGAIECLFITGIHGLECGVIPIVQSQLSTRRFTGELKHSHMHIPNAHPEAVRAGTRTAAGIDLNRQYKIPGEMPVHPGARLLRNMVSSSPIAYIFSFHEDHPDPNNPEQDARPFYVYDIPRPNSNKKTDRLVDRLHKNLIASLSRFGFSVFTGIDDPGDANLGVEFKNGYGNAPSTVHDASFETHMVDLGARGHGTVERAFVFEIPGHATPFEKQVHVSQIFGSFILPFLQEALPLT